jgi:hypothetical protein
MSSFLLRNWATYLPSVLDHRSHCHRSATIGHVEISGPETNHWLSLKTDRFDPPTQKVIAANSKLWNVDCGRIPSPKPEQDRIVLLLCYQSSEIAYYFKFSSLMTAIKPYRIGHLLEDIPPFFLSSFVSSSPPSNSWIIQRAPVQPHCALDWVRPDHGRPDRLPHESFGIQLSERLRRRKHEANWDPQKFIVLHYIVKTRNW